MGFITFKLNPLIEDINAHSNNNIMIYPNTIVSFIKEHYIKEEDMYGNIIETNKYNLFYNVFNFNDRTKFLINEFSNPDKIK